MNKWIIGVIVLVVAGAIAFFALGPGGQEETADETSEEEPIEALPPVTASDRVVAEAEVLPIRDVELRFEIGGTIDEILVAEGDRVDRGTTLVRLDTRDLALDVEESAAQLAQARADLEQLLDGATPDEITAQEARVASAEASLASAQADVNNRQADVSSREASVARASGDLQRTQGEVTQEDINAARARLEEAQATLAELEGQPKDVKVRQLRANLDEARITLEAERDRLSAAKTNAEQQVELRANELRNRQAEYSQVYWDIREIERELNTVDQELWQDQKDREERALRAVQDAEYQLEQARIDMEEAQQAEITGIQQAETNVEEAQAALDELLLGADSDQLARARADVADAQANLSQLTGQQRAGKLAAAQADVNSAQSGVQSALANVEAAQANVEAAQADLEREQANLEDLTAGPRKPEIDDREAAIQQREVALKQAERSLEKASLLAPIDGTVVEMTLEEGERIATSDIAVRMADFSEWKIETTDLTELGVVRIEIGDPVQVTFDALPDLELEGTVTSIQEIGKNQQGDIVYKVTVTPEEWDSRLRWGMTATVAIEPSDTEADDIDASANEDDEDEDEDDE